MSTAEKVAMAESAREWGYNRKLWIGMIKKGGVSFG